MEDSDKTEKRMVDHVLRLDAGCRRMKETWSEANHTTEGWKPKRKQADPYFVAHTAQTADVQRTNSLASVLAYHEKL